MSTHTPGPWTIRYGVNVFGPDTNYPGSERIVAKAEGHPHTVTE